MEVGTRQIVEDHLHLQAKKFRDHATRYLAGWNVLAIERHDQILGLYIPVRPAPDDKVRPALERLTKAVDRVLTETGMTEAEQTAAVRSVKGMSKPA